MPEPGKSSILRHAYTSIPLSTLIYMAWRNLIFKRLRAFLTIFGVVIGIGAIFFLLSFGIGLQHLVTQQVVGNSSIKSIDISSQNTKVVALNNANASKIKHLPHVVQTGTSYSFPGSLKINGSTVDGIVYGIDSGYQGLASLTLSGGSPIDFNGNPKSALVAQAVTDSMGIKNAKSVIGKELTLDVSLAGTGARKTQLTDQYKVVGIINDTSGSEVYIPGSTFTSAGVSSYTQMKILADKTSSVTPLRSQIESQGFVTSSPLDTIDQINQIFKFFNFILVGFGAIGMIVAILGMFNTLTISLLERTKEIGLMVALGGRRIDMRKLFLFEAVLLSVAGAIIGIILAILTGRVINVVMNHLARHRGVSGGFTLFATPPWLIIGMIVFMLCVGLAVVYLPAKHAERIDPIDALRRE